MLSLKRYVAQKIREYSVFSAISNKLCLDNCQRGSSIIEFLKSTHIPCFLAQLVFFKFDTFFDRRSNFEWIISVLCISDLHCGIRYDHKYRSLRKFFLGYAHFWPYCNLFNTHRNEFNALALSELPITHLVMNFGAAAIIMLEPILYVAFCSVRCSSDKTSVSLECSTWQLRSARGKHIRF